MRIFRLMQFESSFDGSVCTDSSRMSPSYIGDGSSFTIKSLRLIGSFTLLDFVQSRLTRVYLSFLLRAMTLEIYLLIYRKTYVAVSVHNCMRRCMYCTAFAHVCVRLCAM